MRRNRERTHQVVNYPLVGIEVEPLNGDRKDASTWIRS